MTFHHCIVTLSQDPSRLFETVASFPVTIP
jgi:hypothetical protein